MIYLMRCICRKIKKRGNKRLEDDVQSIWRTVSDVWSKAVFAPIVELFSLLVSPGLCPLSFLGVD